MAGSHSNTNGVPLLENGETMHLGVHKNQVANRILSVGSLERASMLAELFDASKKVIKITSKRGFTTFTGTFRNTLVSIVATGMGTSSMDFVVRELRCVVEGPMHIVRYGTCGCLDREIPPGSICIASPGSIYVARNANAFEKDSKETPYRILNVVASDERLSAKVYDGMRKAIPKERKVLRALNATACSFYSSQGRKDDAFDDRNDTLHEDIRKAYPNVATLEMESFHLLDLARCSKNTIQATAAVIVIANRPSGEVLDDASIQELERLGGKAILESLVM